MHTTGNARTRAAARAIGILTSAALVFGAIPAAYADTLVTVTVGISNKPYDGGNTASITGCTVDSGVSGGDTVGCITTGANATFNSVNVGTDVAVTVTGLTLDPDAGNVTTDYVIGTINADADITAVTLSAVLSPIDKTYNGNTTASATCSVAADPDLVGGDDVSCVVDSATFADPNVDTDIDVSSTVSLSGAKSGNYQLASASPTGSADINAATLTAILTASDKTYDGTDTATATCSVAADGDLVAGDAADVTCVVDSAAFADANIGDGKTVDSTVSLAGAKSGNYQLASANPTDTADITSDVSVVYTGDTYLVTSSTVTAHLAALLTAESNICLLDDTGDITFTVEDVLDNPVTVDSPSEPNATTATATITVGPGIYTVEVTYDSSDVNCASASDAAVITVVSQGGAANGGGWYRKSTFTGEGSTRANFGFVLNKTYSGTGRNKTWTGYKGQFVWVTGAGWRIKAALAGGQSYVGTFTCPAGVGATGSAPVCAAFQATGQLEQWDATLNGGLGDWVSVGDVTFTVTVYDGGTVTVCKRKACSKTEVADWFGIEVVGYTFAQLPETGPVTLVPSGGKGTIKATV